MVARAPRSDPWESVVPIGLSALAGVLYGLAQAPDAPAVLAWMAVAPLLVACARVPPILAALCGVVFATVATALVSPWFPGMLQRFFGASTPVSWLGWLGLALFVNAPLYAVLCAWFAWRSRFGSVAPLLVGAAWLAVEWLRAYGPVPNPYALLAPTQLGTPLVESADAIGALGVGAAVATGNAVIAALVAPARGAARPLRDSGVAIAAIAMVFAYGAWRGARADADGETVPVALVQPGDRDAAPGTDPLAQLLMLTRAARDEGPMLVFWPESAVDFYLREAGSDRDRVLAATRAPGLELILGGPHYRYADPSPDYFASVFLVRAGHVAGRYDKQRRVPFAEYAPLDGRVSAGTTPISVGERVRPLATSAAPVGAFLCGEVLFPEVARTLSLAGATILANPSNDRWFGAEAPARHQLRVAALRAIENRRPLVRPTTSGYSAILDAHGNTIAISELGRPALLEARIRPSAATTPYQRAGFALAPGAILVTCAASLRRRRCVESGGTRS